MGRIAGCVGIQDVESASREVDRILAALTTRAPARCASPLAAMRIGCRGAEGWAESARMTVALDGALTNAPELARALGAARTPSDAELLLVAFEKWGPGTLERLTGAFALAVVDRTRRTLLLARDHFGTRSLYHTRTGGTWHFASEPMALLRGLPAMSRAVDPAPLLDYLRVGITDHGAATLYSAIAAVPPAHYVEVSLERPAVPRPVPYWRPNMDGDLALSFDEAAQRVRSLLHESVAGHLHTDGRPVGAMLSGGQDTSAIVAATRKVGGMALDLRTFSYLGGDGAVSEAPWIDIVNRAAGATPATMHLTRDAWEEDFDALMDAQQGPFGTIAVSAQYRLYRLAADARVALVFSGVGGDELLGGPPHARMASLLRRGALGALRAGPGAVARGAAYALPGAVTTPIRHALGREVPPWVDLAWFRDRGVAGWEPIWGRGPRTRPLRAWMWHSLTRGLPAVLRYEERNAAAHGVECRHPCLSPALADLMLGIPEAFIATPDGANKAVFRAALRGLVPDPILDRRDKVGFAVPIDTWLPQLPRAIALLESAARLPVVHGKLIAPWIGALKAGRRLPMRESFLAWRLIGLSGWVERCGVEVG